MKQNTDLQDIIGISLCFIIVMLPKSRYIYMTYSIIEQLGVLGNQLSFFFAFSSNKRFICAFISNYNGITLPQEFVRHKKCHVLSQ